MMTDILIVLLSDTAKSSKVYSHSSPAWDLEAGLSPELKFHSPFYLWPQVCLIWKMPPLKPEFPFSESSGLPHGRMTLPGLCHLFQVTHGAPSLSLSLDLQHVPVF